MLFIEGVGEFVDLGFVVDEDAVYHVVQYLFGVFCVEFFVGEVVFDGGVEGG